MTVKYLYVIVYWILIIYNLKYKPTFCYFDNIVVPVKFDIYFKHLILLVLLSLLLLFHVNYLYTQM